MVKPAGPILQAITTANDDLVKFREGASKVQQLRNLVKMADSKEITDPTLRTAVKAAKIELGMEKVSNLPSKKTVGIGVAVVTIAAAVASEHQTGFFSAIFKQLAASFMNFFNGNAEQPLPTQAPAAPLQGPRNFPESSPMQSLKKQILQAAAVSSTQLSSVLPKVTSTPSIIHLAPLQRPIPNNLPKAKQVLSFAQQEQCSPFEEPAATPEPRSQWNDRTLSYAQQEQCSPFEARAKGFTNLSFSELRNNKTQPECGPSGRPQEEPLGFTKLFFESVKQQAAKETPMPQAPTIPLPQRPMRSDLPEKSTFLNESLATNNTTIQEDAFGICLNDPTIGTFSISNSSSTSATPSLAEGPSVCVDPSRAGTFSQTPSKALALPLPEIVVKQKQCTTFEAPIGPKSNWGKGQSLLCPK